MINIDIRKRINCLKNPKPIYPFTFDPEFNPETFRGINPIINIEWRVVDIPGVVKNYYYISNRGVLVNVKGDIIKPCLINSGYYVYRLYTGEKYPNKYKHVLAHRLVMLTFCPIDNPESYTVNHKNHNAEDNRLSNLEWLTQRENNLDNHNTSKGYAGTTISTAKFDYMQLEVIVRELDKGTSYREILDMIGVENAPNNRDYIGNIKRGKTYKNEVNAIRNRFNDYP